MNTSKKRYKQLGADEQLLIINLYHQTPDINKLSESCNVAIGAIRRILSENNIQVKRSKLLEASKALILKDYGEGLSYLDISAKYGISQKSVGKVLRSGGVSVRPCKYLTINERYFEKIDTHSKAYFLGLIMADGCVLWNRPKTVLNQLLIALQARDGYILQDFIEDSQYSGELKLIKRRDSGRQDSYRLSIYVQNFVKELLKFGVSPNKSVSHSFFTNVPDQYLCSAILGYFDGDGSVSFSEKDGRRLSVALISSVEFAERLKEVLNSLGIPCSVRRRHTKAGVIMGECRLKGNRSCIQLYRYLYQGQTTHLKRKKDKFERVLSLQKDGLLKDTNLETSS